MFQQTIFVFVFEKMLSIFQPQKRINRQRFSGRDWKKRSGCPAGDGIQRFIVAFECSKQLQHNVKSPSQ